MGNKYEKDSEKFLKETSKAAREGGAFSKIKEMFGFGESEEEKKKRKRQELIEKERQKSLKQR